MHQLIRATDPSSVTSSNSRHFSRKGLEMSEHATSVALSFNNLVFYFTPCYSPYKKKIEESIESRTSKRMNWWWSRGVLLIPVPHTALLYLPQQCEMHLHRTVKAHCKKKNVKMTVGSVLLG